MHIIPRSSFLEAGPSASGGPQAAIPTTRVRNNGPLTPLDFATTERVRNGAGPFVGAADIGAWLSPRSGFAYVIDTGQFGTGSSSGKYRKLRKDYVGMRVHVRSHTRPPLTLASQPFYELDTQLGLL
jgi:hypothetical protein